MFMLRDRVSFRNKQGIITMLIAEAMVITKRDVAYVLWDDNTTSRVPTEQLELITRNG